MKFIQSAIVMAALFASTEAVRVVDESERHCKGKSCSEIKASNNKIEKENRHIEKVVGEAMAKFVAKHEELEERRANQARTEEKLRETEEKEEKGQAKKHEKDNARVVKNVIKDAEEKLEKEEEESDKKDKINKAKDDQDDRLKEISNKENSKKLSAEIKKDGDKVIA